MRSRNDGGRSCNVYRPESIAPILSVTREWLAPAAIFVHMSVTVDCFLDLLRAGMHQVPSCNLLTGTVLHDLWQAMFA